MVKKAICALAMMSFTALANDHRLGLVLSLPVVHRERLESDIPWSAGLSYEFHWEGVLGLGAELGMVQWAYKMPFDGGSRKYNKRYNALISGISVIKRFEFMDMLIFSPSLGISPAIGIEEAWSANGTRDNADSFPAENLGAFLDLKLTGTGKRSLGIHIRETRFTGDDLWVTYLGVLVALNWSKEADRR